MDFDKDLNLNSVTEIVKLLGVTTDVAQASRSFTYNGVKYDVVKSGNSLTIKSSEGKELSVIIDNTKTKSDEKRNGLDVYYDKHTVDVSYALDNDEYFNLLSTIALDEGYEAFANIERHNLHESKCYEFSFVSGQNEKIAELSPTLDSVKLEGKAHKYVFGKSTIKTDDMVIDRDNFRLSILEEKPVPSMQTILSFNPDHDMSRIKNYVKNKNFHTVSKEIIESIDSLYADKVRFFGRVKAYYNNEVMDVKAADSILKRAKAGVKKLLTTDEIDTCVSVIRDIILEKQKEAKAEQGTALKKDL